MVIAVNPQIDSLDHVEAVMVIEEVFGTTVSDETTCRSVGEMLDLLEAELSNQRPNKHAVKLLRKLAVTQRRPELAEGLEGTWRREQIAAILRELFPR